ncbi:hypothetical protein F5051DRAFT_430294 [Lentinula edodes]|nr:hypothetical protein F5051DRAFT_430294 [Lentinula edodes]
MAQEGSEGLLHVDDNVKGLDFGTSVEIEVIEMRANTFNQMEILRVMKDCWRKEDDDAQQTNDSMAFDGISWLDAINSLAQFNTLVESAYHLVVCMDDIHTHQKMKHSKSLHLPQELKLPSRAGFWFLVVTLNAGKPKVVPVGPIPHIWGVQIVQGLKCAISGCVGAVLTSLNVFLKLIHLVLEQKIEQDIKVVLCCKYHPSIGFSSAEQAELVNSIGSLLHVFGIIKTGEPSMPFTKTGLNGGVWNEEPINICTAQLVLVSALALTNSITGSAVREFILDSNKYL